MPQLQPYVSNVPLQVAKNLRFLDQNGILVTQLLPIGMNGTTVADNPTTGYISCIGAAVSNQIDLYNNVANTLAQYATEITTLQSDVAALQVSGTTIPVVNGYCFTNNTADLITTVTELIAQNSCNYNTVLGTTSALSLAIAAEGAETLNSLQAFSQNSAMAGLRGWVTNPATIADSVNNIWLAYLDLRAGFKTIYNSVVPSCSQVIVDYQVVYNASAGGFNFYFSGYTFIPTGFTDEGSTIKIEDGKGGILQTGFNIVNQSYDIDPLFINSSGSTLSTTVNSYQVTVKSSVYLDTGIGIIKCDKEVVKFTQNAAINYTIGDYYANISGTVSSIPIVSGLGFNPGMVYISASNAFTGNLLQANAYYIKYVSGGAELQFITPPNTSQGGTFYINWTAYKSG